MNLDYRSNTYGLAFMTPRSALFSIFLTPHVRTEEHQSGARNARRVDVLRSSRADRDGQSS